jgi:hypothetical protein
LFENVLREEDRLLSEYNVVVVFLIVLFLQMVVKVWAIYTQKSTGNYSVMEAQFLDEERIRCWPG